MCKPKAQGGQRCFSHAMERYEKALTAQRKATTEAKVDEANFRVQAAIVDLAATPQGAEFVTAKRDAASPRDAVYYDSVLKQAAALAERNRAVGTVGAPERKRGLLRRAPEISPEERTLRETLRVRMDHEAQMEAARRRNAVREARGADVLHDRQLSPLERDRVDAEAHARLRSQAATGIDSHPERDSWTQDDERAHQRDLSSVGELDDYLASTGKPRLVTSADSYSSGPGHSISVNSSGDEEEWVSEEGE